MVGIVNTQGLVAIDAQTGETFTGGAIVLSTLDSTPIGATTPSTVNATIVSAASINTTGDIKVATGRVTASAANTSELNITASAGSASGGLRFSNYTSLGAAQVGTITNSPAAGNPEKWLGIVVGTSAFAIPAWKAS